MSENILYILAIIWLCILSFVFGKALSENQKNRNVVFDYSNCACFPEQGIILDCVKGETE
jgi:glycopeptide antibiotics resistance protein